MKLDRFSQKHMPGPGGRDGTAKRLRALRERLDMSQPIFSASYGLPLATLRNWEAGHGEPPASLITFIGAIETAPEAMRRIIAGESL